MATKDLQHVFIVGSKGIPGNYGGYETFVDRLTEYHQSVTGIRYHVACAVDKMPAQHMFEYNGADCFRIHWRPLGAVRAIFYDLDALDWCLAYIRDHAIKHPIVYVLACRIGPWAGKYARAIHKLGGKLCVNPDGHEWMRAKWPAPVRRYWKVSESGMVKHADLLVCDSKNIEKYIQTEYARFKPATTFIAYGAETRPSKLADDDPKFTGWLGEKGLKPKGYYLVVGRFVPENNYETMIREFMASDSKREFALITKVDDKFLAELKAKTGFDKDPRIKFVGTVYDKELLAKIREQAYGYFHGHEVGGTNPSLLEALGCTDLNLLLKVGFNEEVAEDSALYWTKEPGNLAALIERADAMTPEQIAELGRCAKARIASAYSWQHIANEYARLFLEGPQAVKGEVAE